MPSHTGSPGPEISAVLRKGCHPPSWELSLRDGTEPSPGLHLGGRWPALLSAWEESSLRRLVGTVGREMLVKWGD